MQINDIDIVKPALEPTICGPVSQFRQLTTNANAYTLGWYGFIAGIVATILLYIGVVYAGPLVYAKLVEKGWV